MRVHSPLVIRADQFDCCFTRDYTRHFLPESVSMFDLIILSCFCFCLFFSWGYKISEWQWSCLPTFGPISNPTNHLCCVPLFNFWTLERKIIKREITSAATNKRIIGEFFSFLFSIFFFFFLFENVSDFECRRRTNKTDIHSAPTDNHFLPGSLLRTSYPGTSVSLHNLSFWKRPSFDIYLIFLPCPVFVSSVDTRQRGCHFFLKKKNRTAIRWGIHISCWFWRFWQAAAPLVTSDDCILSGKWS